eukprot:GHVR01123199.1.p1 GENE.GHVR01123199.1~~GHVR01123199.1.p1  ORF type:complete len:574 (+),score=45.49 GHVR01123199.1:88-1809(+)
MRKILIKNQLANISINRNNEGELYITGLTGDITETDIQNAIDNVMEVPVPLDKVVIPRDQAPLVTPGMLDTWKRQLKMKVNRYASDNDVRIHLFDVKPKDFYVNGRITFQKPEEGYAAIRGMNVTEDIGGQQIVMKVNLGASLRLSKGVHDAIQPELSERLDILQRQNINLRVQVKPLKCTNYVIEVSVDNIEGSEHIRKELHELTCGEKVEIPADAMDSFLSNDGRKTLDNISMKTKACIQFDRNMHSLKLYGSHERVAQARKALQKVFIEWEALMFLAIDLRGAGKPSGLMKAILTKYGADLKPLQNKLMVKRIQLDLRRQELYLWGDEESKNRLDEWLDGMCNGLAAHVRVPTKEDIDCVVCFTPVENLAELYRLQVCGHPYCYECIQGMLRSNMMHKDFPIVCASHGCNKKLAIKDFHLLLKAEDQRSLILTSSVDAFIAQHSQTYKYCITADCGMIYQVSTNGKPFHCIECDIRICTTCHAQYHNGLSCAQYKSISDDPETQDRDWLLGDPKKRRMCPKCGIRIEKYEGCNNVKCGVCRVHFCWRCHAAFETENECYKHLQTKHGSFV